MPADTSLATNALLLLVLLAVSTAVWLVLRRRDGAFRAVAAPGAPVDHAAADVAGRDEDRLEPADVGLPHATWSEAARDGAVGTRGTFVQISSAGCATCPQVSRMLSGLVADGVVHVEVDAAEHLGLVRRLGVMRTPTVLLVDGDGVLVSRTSGTVRAEQALAALEQLCDGRRSDLVATGEVR